MHPRTKINLGMKVLKALLLVAILWGTLAALVLAVVYYSRDKLVVEIHWKNGQTQEISRRSITLDDIMPESIAPRNHSITSKVKQPTYETDSVVKPPTYSKLSTLPVHTLESMTESCTDPLCLKNLSDKERVYFSKCKQKAISMENKFGPITNTGQCRFQNGTNRVPVALASFPGSGNTWVRGLLEKVTGLCTGALYCDCGLRTKGFTGEGIRGPSALVIKAHSKNALFSNNKLPRRLLHDVPVYGGAILLVRDPRKALVAEWHRERSKRRTNSTVSNHYLYVGKEYFGTNDQWDRYVKDRTERWRAHVSGWIISGRSNPFLIVRYEDLKQNTVREVLRMVEFLGFKGLFTEESIQDKLGGGYSGFYRNHQDNFEHFTSDQKALIEKTVRETVSLLAERGLEQSFPIKDYL